MLVKRQVFGDLPWGWGAQLYVQEDPDWNGYFQTLN